MPFVTEQRWANRRWTSEQFTRGSRHSLWGVPCRVQLHEQHSIQAEGDLDGDDDALIGAGGVGRHFDLAGGSRLIWRHVTKADRPHPLRPFETYPGELDYMCDNGVRVSMLRLSTVPADPVWRHRITVPPGTTFVHQPALTQGEREQGATRPAAIVGSYDVRDATDCKIAHILRPRAIDQNGDSVWGRIRIANGVSTVRFNATPTMTAAFNALTPPIVLYGLDTIGFTSKGGSQQGGYPSTYVFCNGPWLGAAGTATAISWYCWANNGPDYLYGFYDEDAAEPDLLVGTTDRWQGGAINGFLERSLEVNKTITAQNYWIAFWSDESGSGVSLYYDVDAAYEIMGDNNHAAGYPLPSPIVISHDWGSGYKMSCFIRYTPSGGGSKAYIIGGGIGGL